jgi:isopenicillin N synthase-like dioxygenase
LYEKIYWPCNDQGFKEMILKYQKIYYNNSIYLMNLIGEGLGLGSNYFDYLFV